MSDTPETDEQARMEDLERERDMAREALRDLCNKIALRMMAENPDQERLELIESHKRAEALLSKALT